MYPLKWGLSTVFNLRGVPAVSWICQAFDSHQNIGSPFMIHWGQGPLPGILLKNDPAVQDIHQGFAYPRNFRVPEGVGGGWRSGAYELKYTIIMHNA